MTLLKETKAVSEPVGGTKPELNGDTLMAMGIAELDQSRYSVAIVEYSGSKSMKIATVGAQGATNAVHLGERRAGVLDSRAR